MAAARSHLVGSSGLEYRRFVTRFCCLRGSEAAEDEGEDGTTRRGGVAGGKGEWSVSQEETFWAGVQVGYGPVI